MVEWVPFAAGAVPEAIAALPKVNLHTHLEGSVRPTTVIELAQAQGIRLPLPAGQVAAAMQVSGRESSLADYLERVRFVQPVLKDAVALRRVAREAAEDQAHDHVRYLELRAGPAIHVTRGLPVEDVIAAILAGLADAEAQTGITCRFIVAALRHDPPQVNVELAHAAVAFRGRGVVGFDLAGDEAAYPAHLHREAFAVARAGGLGITVHAGEAGGADAVRYAVCELGATRIGHGVRAIDDPNTVRLLAERRVTLEICPTSNVHTHAVSSITAHPLPHFLTQGVQVTIGDDDPITSQTRVSQELALIGREFGLPLETLRALQVMGLQASFLEDEARRAALLAEMQAP